MRYPMAHTFLKWAGPSILGAVATSLLVIAALAEPFPGVRSWALRWYSALEPAVTASWFVVLTAFLILGYIVALIYTGGGRKLDGHAAAASASDFSIEMWASRNEFTLLEAASLWVGIPPPHDPAHIAPKAVPILSQLKQAVIQGKLKPREIGAEIGVNVERVLAYEERRAPKVDSETTVHRSYLLHYALQQGDVPAFLAFEARNRRRALIDQARDAAHAFPGEKVTSDFYNYIEKQRPYLDIRKHLSDDFREKLMRSGRTGYVMPEGSHYCGMQSHFLDELDRLESEWGLDDEQA